MYKKYWLQKLTTVNHLILFQASFTGMVFVRQFGIICSV